MKHLYTFFFILSFPLISLAQQNKIDSLKIEFNQSTKNSAKLDILINILNESQDTNFNDFTF